MRIVAGRRLAVLVAMAALGGAWIAPSAQGATVSVEDGVLTYRAEAGEVNELEIFPEGALEGAVYVYEFSAPLEGGPGCLPAPEPFFLPAVFISYVCSGVSSASIDVGDENDYAGAYLEVSATVAGGDGKDEISGGFADDSLDGGPGDDSVTGGPGADTVVGGADNDKLDGDFLVGGEPTESGTASSREPQEGGKDKLDGGPGDDELRGGPEADAISGGDGTDLADYASRDKAVAVTLDGTSPGGDKGERDVLSVDVEDVQTGSGNDTVRGNDQVNKISTGAGDDTVDAAGAADRVSLGPGADTAQLRDPAIDAVECGEGLPDTVTVDAADVVGGDCEVVKRGKVKPAGLTLAARVISGSGDRKIRLRVSGRLRLPSGTPSAVCVGGRVRVVVQGGAGYASVDVPLSPRCGYSTTVRLPHARRIRARVTFAGNETLRGARSRAVRVRSR